jgi:DNA-directed RNA polymerase beta subunit
VLGIKNAQKLVPLVDDEDRKPRDPVSENMDVINGKPVKAFIYQDHEAHIAVHMAAMQDPQLQQMLGQSPNAQAMSAAMAAHLQEHLAFEYRRQIEQQAGVPLPPPNAEMDENTELAVSRLAAAASAQLLQKNQAEAQMQQNQQMAQDPLVQMQQAELQLKQQELQLKAQKMMIEAAEKNDRIEVEKERIAAQKEIAGLQVGAKISTDKANLSAKQQLEGLRIGVQVAKEATAASQPKEPPVPNAAPKETK